MFPSCKLYQDKEKTQSLTAFKPDQNRFMLFWKRHIRRIVHLETYCTNKYVIKNDCKNEKKHPRHYRFLYGVSLNYRTAIQLLSPTIWLFIILATYSD